MGTLKFCQLFTIAPSGQSSSTFPSLAKQFICLDVANGYSQFFVEFVAKVRGKFPEHTIMVSQPFCREYLLRFTGPDCTNGATLFYKNAV